MDIHYLKYKDINKSKWDASIFNARLNLPYAYSWYLDVVCTKWDALVSTDYTTVFPLPYNNKLLGKAQLYQPVFTQQLGIYSNQEVTQEISAEFLKAIPDTFQYMDIMLNENVAFKPFGKFSSYRKTLSLIHI